MDSTFNEKLITTKDAGEISGYTSDYLSRLVRSGKIIGKRVGRSWVIDKESLTHFLDRQDTHNTNRARLLANARAEEYRTHRSFLHRTTKKLIESLSFSPGTATDIGHPVSDMSERNLAKSSLRLHALALSVALFVVVSGAFAARASLISRVAENVATVVREAAFGFDATFGDIPARIVSKIDTVGNDVRKISSRVAAANAVTTAGIASPLLAEPNLSSLRMAPLETRTKNVLADLQSTSLTGQALDVPMITADDVRTSVRDVYAMVVSPSRIADALANAYVALGEDSYIAIAATFSAYDSLIETSGAEALAFAATTRDTLADAPEFVAEVNLAFGKMVITATHAAIRADVAAAYGLATAAPASARATVAFVGGAGAALSDAAAELPRLASSLFLRATSAPAHLAPALAQAVFDAEYAIAEHFVAATGAISDQYLVLVKGTSNVAYAGGQSIYNLQFTMPTLWSASRLLTSGFTIPEFSNIATTIQDAYLGALGATALALSHQMDALTSVPQVAAALGAALDALSPVERVALATYEIIHDFFTSTTNALATFFTSTPAPIAPAEKPSLAVATSTPKVPTTTAARPATIVTGPTYPTYVTTVNGVSEDFVNESLASLRTELLARVSSLIQPVSNQVATNITTIQQVNMIQDLSNLIVRNGDFRGGTFDGGTLSNGLSVSATTGTFDTLIAGATTLGAATLATTTVSGDLTLSGILTASTSATAPFFTATSLTATSTFAGPLAIGTTTPFGAGLFTVGTTSPLLYIDSTTGNLGIGTSSPSSTLALSGNFILTGTTTVTGTNSGIIFTGAGNHDITASAGTLRIGSNTIIGNIQALDNTVDIGTPSVRFDKIYANEVNASTIVGTLTGGNLTAETFNINSDNATADIENSYLSFERGSTIPNALLSWNAAESAKRFEFNQPLFIQDASASTTNTTLTLQSVVGQTGDIFRIASSSSATTLFNVTASGNVGVGTTSPAMKLHVVASDNNMALIEQSTSGYGASLNFKANGESSAYLTYFPTNYPNSVFTGSAVLTSSAVNGSVMLRASDTTGIIKFLTGGSAASNERMRITSTGNVGIGTTSPGANLEVVGGFNTIYATRYSAGGIPSMAFRSARGTDSAPTTLLDNDAIGRLYFNYYNGSIWKEGAYVESNVTDAAGYLTDMSFWTSNNGLGQRMVIKSNGNVGIGTTSPVSKLSVVGESALAGGLSVGLGYAGTTAPSNGLIIQGNVGIGTTSPSSLLSVQGNSYVSGTAFFGGAITATSTLNVTGLTTLGNASTTQIGSTGSAYFATSGGNVGIGTTTPLSKLAVSGGLSVGADYNIAAPTNGMIIQGNVGIGTTGPGAKLDVNGTPANPPTSGTTSGGIFRIRGTNAVLESGIFSSPVNSAWIQVDNATAYGNYYGLSLQPNGGNVGIGTANPTINGGGLEISGGAQRGIRITNTAGATTEIGSDSTGGFIQTLTANANFRLYTGNGSEAVRVLSTGNVGIGTTSPSRLLSVSDVAGFSAYFTGWVGIGNSTPAAKLHISGTGGTGSSVLIENTNSANYAVQEIKSPGSDNNIYAFGNTFTTSGKFIQNSLLINAQNDLSLNSDNIVHLFTSGTEKVTILNNGNVGIGTTNPANATLSIKQTNANNRLSIYSNSTDAHVRIGHDGTRGIIDTTYDSVAGYTDLWLNTSNSAIPRIAILSTGNVGIGTTGPGAQLEVHNATPTLASSATLAYNTVPGNGSLILGLGDSGTTDTTNGIFFKSFAAGGFYNRAVISNRTTGNEGNLDFYTQWAGDGNLYRRMTIDTSGNVGIGTTNPFAKLTIGNGGGSVYGTNVLDMDVKMASQYGVAFEASGDDSALTIKDATGVFNIGSTYGNTGAYRKIQITPGGNAALVLQATGNGNVGIGTTSPAYKLDVYGDTSIRSGSALRLWNAANNAQAAVSNDGVSGGAILGFYTSGTAAMSILGNGNVGIGTTSPVSKLSVVGESALAGGLSVGLGYAGTTAPSNGLIIQGNVGIGTTGPGTKLEVVGATGVPSLSSDSTGIFTVRNGTTNETLQFGSLTASPYSSWIQAKDSNNIGNSYPISLNPLGGNVGIGTTGPTKKLQISDNSTTISLAGASEIASGFGGLWLSQPTPSATNYSMAQANNGSLYVNTVGTGTNIYFRSANANELVTIQGSGNVGIGTTGPYVISGTSLDVRGAANSSIISGRTANVADGADFGSFAFVAPNASGNQRVWGKIRTIVNTATEGSENSSLVFSTQSAGAQFEAMRIAVGNVGIGTTSPAQTLSVQGNQYTSGTAFFGGAITATSTLNVSGVTTLATSLAGLLGANAGAVYSFASSSLFGYTPLNPTRNINTTFPILGGGDLSADRTFTFGGLSTSTAAVIGNIPYFSGVNTFANVATTTFAVSGPFTTSGTLGALVGGTNSTITYTGLATTTALTQGNLLYSSGGAGVTSVATSSVSYGLGFTTGGTFGALVGGSAPTLSIATSSLYSGTTGQFPYFSGTNIITATSSLFLATSGNVGVGTVVPGGLLQIGTSFAAPTIGGQLSIYNNNVVDGHSPLTINLVQTANSLQENAINFQRTHNNYGLLASGTEIGRINFNGADGFTLRNAAQIMVSVDGVAGAGDMPGRITFSTTPDNSATLVERMRITNTGNVGIGTTSPSVKLHIYNSGGDGQFRVEAGTTGNATMQFYNASSGALADMYSTNSKDLIFRTNGVTEAMRILSTGNVGIGTTSPVSKLSVVGESALAGGLSVGLGYAGTTAPSNGLIIQGNVGIGTTNPAAPLSFGAGYGTPKIYAYDDGTYVSGIGSYSPDTLRIFGDSLNQLITFGSQTRAGTFTEAMRIKSGNVGIGTTSPATKLEVGGNTANVTFDGYLNCAGFTSDANGKLACTASDERLKQNIASLATSSALAGINALNPVSFNWRDAAMGPNQQFGLIAQGVQNVFPNLVQMTNPTELTPGGTLTVNYLGLISPMIASIQELDARTRQILGADGVLSLVPGVESQCVTGDTRLRRRRKRADGSFEFDEVDIKDVVAGDEVASLDERTGTVVYSRVNALIDMGEQEVYELVTKSGRRIRTTSNHPFLARAGATKS